MASKGFEYRLAVLKFSRAAISWAGKNLSQIGSKTVSLQVGKTRLSRHVPKEDTQPSKNGTSIILSPKMSAK